MISDTEFEEVSLRQATPPSSEFFEDPRQIRATTGAASSNSRRANSRRACMWWPLPVRPRLRAASDLEGTIGEVFVDTGPPD